MSFGSGFMQGMGDGMQDLAKQMMLKKLMMQQAAGGAQGGTPGGMQPQQEEQQPMPMMEQPQCQPEMMDEQMIAPQYQGQGPSQQEQPEAMGSLKRALMRLFMQQ